MMDSESPRSDRLCLQNPVDTMPPHSGGTAMCHSDTAMCHSEPLDLD